MEIPVGSTLVTVAEANAGVGRWTPSNRSRPLPLVRFGAPSSLPSSSSHSLYLQEVVVQHGDSFVLFQLSSNPQPSPEPATVERRSQRSSVGPSSAGKGRILPVRTDPSEWDWAPVSSQRTTQKGQGGGTFRISPPALATSPTSSSVASQAQEIEIDFPDETECLGFVIFLFEHWRHPLDCGPTSSSPNQDKSQTPTPLFWRQQRKFTTSLSNNSGDGQPTRFHIVRKAGGTDEESSTLEGLVLLPQYGPSRQGTAAAVLLCWTPHLSMASLFDNAESGSELVHVRFPFTLTKDQLVGLGWRHQPAPTASREFGAGESFGSKPLVNRSIRSQSDAVGSIESGSVVGVGSRRSLLQVQSESSPVKIVEDPLSIHPNSFSNGEIKVVIAGNNGVGKSTWLEWMRQTSMATSGTTSFFMSVGAARRTLNWCFGGFLDCVVEVVELPANGTASLYQSIVQGADFLVVLFDYVDPYSFAWVEERWDELVLQGTTTAVEASSTERGSELDSLLTREHRPEVFLIGRNSDHPRRALDWLRVEDFTVRRGVNCWDAAAESDESEGPVVVEATAFPGTEAKQKDSEMDDDQDVKKIFLAQLERSACLRLLYAAGWSVRLGDTLLDLAEEAREATGGELSNAASTITYLVGQLGLPGPFLPVWIRMYECGGLLPSEADGGLPPAGGRRRRQRNLRLNSTDASLPLSLASFARSVVYFRNLAEFCVANSVYEYTSYLLHLGEHLKLISCLRQSQSLQQDPVSFVTKLLIATGCAMSTRVGDPWKVLVEDSYRELEVDSEVKLHRMAKDIQSMWFPFNSVQSAEDGSRSTFSGLEDTWSGFLFKELSKWRLRVQAYRHDVDRPASALVRIETVQKGSGTGEGNQIGQEEVDNLWPAEQTLLPEEEVVTLPWYDTWSQYDEDALIRHAGALLHQCIQDGRSIPRAEYRVQSHCTLEEWLQDDEGLQNPEGAGTCEEFAPD